jgi:hypothetical protein
MVTKLKLKGGLGVINLTVQNEALLMKNLHKFFNKQGLPWVQLIWTNYYNNGRITGQTKKGSFWWKDNLKLLNIYKGIAPVEARKGDTINFWQDMWNGRVLSQLYPHLFSFTTNENISLFSALELNELEDPFHLPLSEEAYTQFCDLNIYMQAFQHSGEANQWEYIWGNGHIAHQKHINL